MLRLQELFIAFTSMMKEYPWLGFAVSAWGLTILTLVFRKVPSAIFGFLRRQLSTTLVFDSSYTTGDRDTFDELMKWFGENRYAGLSRTIRIYFRWIQDPNNPNTSLRRPVIGVSENRQLIFWEGLPCLVSCSREGGDKMIQSEYTPYIVTIVRLGRNRESVIRLVETMQKQASIDIPVKRKLTGSDWFFTGAVRKRPLHTVATNNNLVESIVARIREFDANEQWYLDRGIPYKLCICLYGPPGTGKNTIVRAVASELKRGIDYVNLSSTTDHFLSQALLTSGNTRALILFDDFDLDNFKPRNEKLRTNIAAPTLEEKAPAEEPKSASENEEEKGVTLRGILSVLDGEDTPHGRIFFMTTNDISNLDKAITRPGRMDMIEYVGLLEDRAIKTYIKGQYELDSKQAAHRFAGLRFNPVSGAQLEQLYKQYPLDLDSLIRELALISKENTNGDSFPAGSPDHDGALGHERQHVERVSRADETAVKVSA